MEKITKKEEELMEFFWDKGPQFVRDIVEMYPDPKPHINTVSTMVRSLESKGYVGHKQYGNTFQYFAIVDREKFSSMTLKGVISKYFGNSFKSAVSALVSDEELSVDDLKELLKQVEQQK
ncbi:MAG: BlaI/MecI/CopY family transcriptional regulator [Bacteroidales bacterium]|nr:BlaI/MecI/CopY family transcriptional regulator [Bacteroidales bacterium]